MRKWRSRAENQSSVPLFDWHDRPFVPTCPHVEHRAQRQARLVWPTAAGGLALPEVGSCDHCRSCRKRFSRRTRRKRRRGNSYPVDHRSGRTQLPRASARGLGRPGRAGPLFCGGVLQPCAETVARPSRLVGGQRPPVQCPLGSTWFQARSSTPSGITPVPRYLHSATTSLRASATTRIRRSRPLVWPTRSRNQPARRLPGW
jgi:hypothetical protein